MKIKKRKKLKNKRLNSRQVLNFKRNHLRDNYFEELSKQPVDIQNKAIIKALDEDIENAHYLIARMRDNNLFKNMSVDTLAQLFETSLKRDRGWVSFSAFESSDGKRYGFCHEQDYILGNLKVFVPEDKRAEVFTRISGLLSENNKKIGYAAIVPSKDREMVKQQLGTDFSKKDIVELMKDGYEGYRERGVFGDFGELFIDDIIENYEDELSMDDFDKIMDKVPEFMDDAQKALFIKHSKKISPSQLARFLEKTLSFSKEERYTMIKENLGRFDYYTLRNIIPHAIEKSDRFSNDTIELSKRSAEVRDNKMILLEKLGKHPYDEMIEKMNEHERYLWNEDLKYLSYGVSKDNIEDFIDRFKEHMNSFDLERILESQLSKGEESISPLEANRLRRKYGLKVNEYEAVDEFVESVKNLESEEGKKNKM